MGQHSAAGSGSGIGVLDKAAAILDAVATEPRALAELVAATGLPRATAHRLAVALQAHGLLARDAEGRFILGRRIAELAAALHVTLPTAKTHVSRILTKLGARDRTQLVVIAYETGLVIPGGP